MIHGKHRTVEEDRWISDCIRLGCIVCRIQGRGYVPCEFHHMLSGGIRMGHLFGFGLCSPGHHRNCPKGYGEVSRHPNKAEFERRYGTEEFLLEVTQRAVKEILPK